MEPIRLSFWTIILFTLANIVVPLGLLGSGLYLFQDNYDARQRAKAAQEHYAQFEANTISTRMESVDNAYSKLLAVALPIQGTDFQGHPPGEMLSAFKTAHDGFIDSLYILTSYCQTATPVADKLVNNTQTLYRLKTVPQGAEYKTAINNVKNGYSATITAAKKCMKEKLRKIFEDESNAN